MNALASLAAGLIFGVGLALAGMTDPRKVLGFLDVSGDWDPSLLLVLGGAVVVAFVGFRFVLRRPAPVFADVFHVPPKRAVDAKLVAGAALFGVGWGIGGYCPGPAFTLLGIGAGEAWIFVPAMLAGFVARHAWGRLTAARSATGDASASAS